MSSHFINHPQVLCVSIFFKRQNPTIGVLPLSSIFLTRISQMRTSLVVTFLLIISILLSHAQGIRFNKGFLSQKDNTVQKDEVTRTKSNEAYGEAVNPKDYRHISGEIRKLMAKGISNPSSSITSTTSKNDGNKPIAIRKIVRSRDEDECLSVNSTIGLEHKGTTTVKYPDTIDLAGMDYSPAKRKPPIHN